MIDPLGKQREAPHTGVAMSERVGCKHLAVIGAASFRVCSPPQFLIPALTLVEFTNQVDQPLRQRFSGDSV
jgi:hypothetical protein